MAASARHFFHRRPLIRLVQVGTWFRPPADSFDPDSRIASVAEKASMARGRIGSRLASTESEAEAKVSRVRRGPGLLFRSRARDLSSRSSLLLSLVLSFCVSVQ